MRRRLFTTLSALSLLLCVAVCVLWVRSYWMADVWQARNLDYYDARDVWVEVEHGTLTYWSGEYYTASKGVPSTNDPPPMPVEWQYSAMPPAEARNQRWPLWVERKRPDPADPRGIVAGTQTLMWSDEIRIRLWLVCLGLMCLPTWWVVQKRRETLLRPGLCPACGYDLRATPHRCPECGREAGAEKAATPS